MQPKVVNEKSNKITWIIGGVVFVLLAAGAIYLGTKNIDSQYSNIFPKKLAEPTGAPKIISKFEPEPTFASRLTPTGEPPRITTARPLWPEPSITPEVEPSVVPDGDPKESGYLLPTSNSQKLTQEDLVGLSDLDLKKARNEIYARHGRPFVHQDLACYFSDQSWYEVNSDYSAKLLSSLELSNATFILNYEKEIDSPFINKDSGCAQN